MSLTDRQTILVAINSGGVTVYRQIEDKVLLLARLEIKFEKGFCPDTGISSENKQTLFEFVAITQEKYPDLSLIVYATTPFRQLAAKAQEHLCAEFKKYTSLSFNIIDAKLEHYYLETAIASKYPLEQPILLIHATEDQIYLSVLRDGEVEERVEASLGLNFVEKIETDSLEVAVDIIAENLPPLRSKLKTCLLLGGSLTLMWKNKYPLRVNTVFHDDDHLWTVTTKNLCEKNKQHFKQLPSLIAAQAICQKYRLSTLIPSDTTFIHGVAKT